MKKYIGCKMIEAEPTNRGDYNLYRGWTIPDDENPLDDGYLVKYPDGYISWSPSKQFEEAYRECDCMTFGLAVEAMKKGHKVARKGWNGKGMFLYLVPEGVYPARMEAIKGYFKGDQVPYGSYVAMKTAQDNVVPWLASQTDILAEDWTIIE